MIQIKTTFISMHPLEVVVYSSRDCCRNVCHPLTNIGEKKKTFSFRCVIYVQHGERNVCACFSTFRSRASHMYRENKHRRLPGKINGSLALSGTAREINKIISTERSKVNLLLEQDQMQREGGSRERGRHKKTLKNTKVKSKKQSSCKKQKNRK